MRELIGELMISSNAGTTLPDALTDTSIVPLSTVENNKSFRAKLDCIKRTIPPITTTAATTPVPIFIHCFRRSRCRTSFGISLSILCSFLFSCQILHKIRAKNITYS